MPSTGTPISGLPTGTIDSILDVFPMDIGITGSTPQTIKSSLLQLATFLQVNGLVVSGSYALLDNRYINTHIDGVKITRNHATGTSVESGQLYTQSGDFIHITGSISQTHTGLITGSFYHIYAYLNSGTPNIEYSQTAPITYEGIAKSKTGDTSRRYIGTFKVDGTGSIYDFLHELPTNMVHYKNVLSDNSPFRVVNGGTGTSATTITCGGIVPPTSRAAQFNFFNAGTASIYTNEANIINSSRSFTSVLPLALQNHVFHPLNASQQLFYIGSTGAIFYADVVGYSFER